MNNNKQSSVEWFIDQLEEKGDAWENASIRRVNISIDVSKYMELKIQAKAMHREEIINAWRQGDGLYDKVSKEMSVQYYNETYGGEDDNH